VLVGPDQGGATAWQMEGTYFENCSCDRVCPCTTSGLTMPADRERCRVVSEAQHASVDVFGMSFTNDGKNGHWAPFSWAS